MARPLHPGSGRPPARRRCFVCGIAPNNSAGVFVAAVCISRGSYLARKPGAKARRMIAASLSVGLCELCLADAMRDGRVYASRNLRATLRLADKPAVSASR